jgi:phenylacetate-CoA ligase
VYPSQIEDAFSHVKGVVPNYYLTPIEKEQMCVALDIDVEIDDELVAQNLKQIPMIILILSEASEKI